MRNATVASAVEGCQAEVGVASAMAASAAVELMGGTPKQCLDAASTVLMNMLGLGYKLYCAKKTGKQGKVITLCSFSHFLLRLNWQNNSPGKSP